MCSKFAIDIFSGAGGSTQAAKKFFNIITAIEYDPIFSKTYELNHGSHIYTMDIKQTDKKFWENQIENIPNKNLDLLVATPPCQGFSKHSRTKVIESIDERNNLIMEIVRISAITKPSFIFMENVTNIINYKIFHKFLKQLSNIKKNGEPKDINRPSYHLRFESVTSSDFDVPQNRKRMILIAKKIDNFPCKEAYILFPKDNIPFVLLPLNIWPEKKKSLFLGEYLQKFDLPKIKAGETCTSDKLHKSRKLSELNLKRIMKTPLNGGSRKDWPDNLMLDCHKGGNVSYGDVYGRMSYYKYAPTITCGCISYTKGRFGHPVENRAISLREAALIQTFPIDYKFTGKINGEIYEGSMDKIATQIGNAIPIKLGEAFFKEIFKNLN